MAMKPFTVVQAKYLSPANEVMAIAVQMGHDNAEVPWELVSVLVPFLGHTRQAGEASGCPESATGGSPSILVAIIIDDIDEV